ncbi:MAG TPA: hypothetical protein H9976_00895 [Candidatus Akkermansia intestinavium]|nr:hypothetical protein [Candidatus Akkermansia intestinavium]
MKSYFLFVAFGLAIQAPRFSQEGQEILFHFIRQSTKKAQNQVHRLGSALVLCRV